MKHSLTTPFKIKTFGSSMQPLFKDQDILYFKKVKFFNLKVNDIVCLKKRGKIFTHRIIYKSRNYLISKGDGNPISDGKIYPKNVLGLTYKAQRGKHFFNPEDLYLFQSTLYFKEIIRVKKMLEKEGVDYVFLKGLPLYLYYEGEHPRRFYADCDILVSKKFFNRIERIFYKFGYKKIETSNLPSIRTDRKRPNEVSFYKMKGAFPIIFDVHSEVFFMNSYLGDLDLLYSQENVDKLTKEFLKEKEKILVQEETFPVLSPENLLIYLSLHLFNHLYKAPYRYRFISIIIKSSNFNYNIIEKKIKNYQLENFIYPCFLLLEKFNFASLPSSFLSSIKPSKKRMAYIEKNILKTNIFNDKGRVESGARRFQNLFFLSPNPIYIRLKIFLKAEVVFGVFWVSLNRLKRYLA